MPTTIVDLDVVLAPPKRVKLGGKTYLLPADIPVPLYLSVKARQEAEGENADVVQALHQQVLELFQVHQPDMTVIPCGMAQLFEIIPLIYGADESEGKPQGQNGRGGRPKSSRSKPTRRSAS